MLGARSAREGTTCGEVGRSRTGDLVLPAAHFGVSGKHLTLVSTDQDGVWVEHDAHSRNGSTLGGVPLPERFQWRFGQRIVLADGFADAPPVQLTLKRG